MALNLQSLSITSVFNSIVNFFRSQENNSRWKDLTVGSEGSFLIRLLSNVFSAISYRIVAQSRENYLSTAALVSSNTGIAVNLGYSVFRGQNPHRRVTIRPNGNYTFPKLSVIGTYSSEYDIIALTEDDGTDLELRAGEDKEINVVIGKLKEESFTTGTRDVKVFSLFTTGISEDYVLYLDGQEVPTTKIIKELKDDKYLVRTNPFSSVDVAYLNTSTRSGTGKYRYGTGSQITIRYVELQDIDMQQLTTEMFAPYGEVLGVKNTSEYLPFESVDSIKVTAPLGHELQNLIRSKADYAGRLRMIIPTIINTNWRAVTPTYTQISYLKDDNTLLSEDERDKVLDILKEENYFGTPLPDITVPRREVAYLQVDVNLSNKYKNISDVDEDVTNIINNFYNRELALTFSTFDLERKIESLAYVKYARVHHVINTRKNVNNYQLGYILEKDGNYYIASKILGISGDSTPDWGITIADESKKTIDLGNPLIQDGSLKWKAYKRLPNMSTDEITLWSRNTEYGIGDFVYDPAYENYMFKCVDLVKSSGNSFPNVGIVEIGDFIQDESIVWVVTKYNEANPNWEALTNYSLGDKVNTSAVSGYSLECVSYTGTTGTNPNLDFEDNTYPIVAVNDVSRTFTVSGNKTFYFRAQDVISAESPQQSYPFTVKSSIWDEPSNQTIITVSQEVSPNIDYRSLVAKLRGTRDGQILWTLIDNIDEISYDWNTYVTFQHKLNILE